MHFQFRVPTSNNNSPRPRALGFPTSHRDQEFGPLAMPPWVLPLRMTEEFVSPKTCLTVQDADCHTAYFVKSGIFRLSRYAADGSRIIIGFRAEGCLLDASAVTLDIPSWCTAEALTPSTVMTLPSHVLRSALAENNDLVRAFNQRLIREISFMEDQEVSLRVRSADERLLQLMSEFHESLSALANLTETVPVKHLDVASMLGITPSHLSRLLKRHSGEDQSTRATRVA